jgi:hypothetical protein
VSLAKWIFVPAGEEILCRLIENEKEIAQMRFAANDKKFSAHCQIGELRFTIFRNGLFLSKIIAADERGEEILRMSYPRFMSSEGYITAKGAKWRYQYDNQGGNTIVIYRDSIDTPALKCFVADKDDEVVNSVEYPALDENTKYFICLAWYLLYPAAMTADSD